LNTIVINPEKNFIDEIFLLLKNDDKNYSNNLVVFPGKRPSHFLLKSIADNLKSSFIPPKILSMDEFIDFLYQKIRIDTKIKTIDAVAILYDIHKKALEPMGGDYFQSPDSFFPLGLKIYRDLEELYIENIKSSNIRQIDLKESSIIPEQTLKRMQSLSFFYDNFYRLISEQGLSTRSFRYREVSENIDSIDLSQYSRLIFAGFFALTTSEKILFRNISKNENAVFIFQEGTGLKEKLLELGIKIDNFVSSKKYDINFNLYSSPDSHGQVYCLGKIIKENLNNVSNEISPVAIVLPSSEILFPLIRQGLSFLNEENYNISLGYPLERTPIFGFLNNLMELINSMDENRVYVPDYLKFALHPYTKNIYFNGRSEVTRIMFHTIEELFSKDSNISFIELTGIEENENILREIYKRIADTENIIKVQDIKEHLKNIHQNTINKFINFQNINDFAKKCSDILIYIFNNSTAKLHPLFYPFSESFLRELDIIEKSMLGNFSFTETSSYFGFFKKYIMTAYNPFEGTPLKNIQILGFLETRNIKFKKVYLLDANEDIIPDTRKDDTLIPFKTRRMLGLPTYLDRDKLTEYYFDVLIKSADEVNIFFVENDKNEKSRFVEKLIWEKQKKDKVIDIKNYIQTVQYKVNLDNPLPEKIDKTPDTISFLKNMHFHATALDTYLKCQLKFYYSYILRLKKKEEISGDIERTDIGQFVHAILKEFFGRKKGRILKQKDLNENEITKITDKFFEENFDAKPKGSLYLIKYQIKNHLKDLINNYYKPLISKERLAIIDTEKSLNIFLGSFILKGRLDSIEKRGDKVYVIDYKTGASPNYLKINFNKLNPEDRSSWDDAIGSIQLPFYILLYSKFSGLNPLDIKAMFLFLGRSYIEKSIEAPLFEKNEEIQKYSILEDIIIKLLNEIIDPLLPFNPAKDKKKTCPDCDFKYICGTQWIVK